MSDWRSYDGIADRYDHVASSRFRAVALKMWGRLRPSAGARLLDVGTGTGVVPRAASETGIELSLAVGADRAERMVSRATQEASWLRVLVCDAVALPFCDQSFDIATASFVLSHLREPHGMLREARRVLRASGAIAVSSWGPATDPFTAAWSECLAEAITRVQAERASSEVIPSESRFSEWGGLESALKEAGFSMVASDVAELHLAPSVAEFVRDRELTAGGRLGRSLLGTEEWARFTARVRTSLEGRFGPELCHSRRAFIAVARKIG